MNADNIDILAIDDDKFIQKVIVKSLQSEHVSVRTADSGEEGIEEALRKVPSLILLDVEMPGIKGYEVCERLKNTRSTQNIPIVFLSSCSSLRERMQGYEVGGDDYLVKPFEKEYLQARVNILLKYQAERVRLQEDFELAHKSAMMAMTGSSELGLAIKFMEKSISCTSIDELVAALFEITDQFSIQCCAMITEDDQLLWFSSENTATSPLEKELIEMCDKESRFLDFGSRTIVNFPKISLLVKNMPLDDIDRYGRIKDLLPLLLSAANTKLRNISTYGALTQQSENLYQSFKGIKNSLYVLCTTLVNNRVNSEKTMGKLAQDLNYDFLRMGLEEDQEQYLLERIDTTVEKAMVEMDSGREIRDALTFVLNNLNSVISQQKGLLDDYTSSIEAEADNESKDMEDNIELF